MRAIEVPDKAYLILKCEMEHQRGDLKLSIFLPKGMHFSGLDDDYIAKMCNWFAGNPYESRESLKDRYVDAVSCLCWFSGKGHEKLIGHRRTGKGNLRRILISNVRSEVHAPRGKDCLEIRNSSPQLYIQTGDSAEACKNLVLEIGGKLDLPSSLIKSVSYYYIPEAYRPTK
ncbi:MAG TPA: hypothetical protein PKI32_07150 [Opitutales bacterium]|nr:hypothetical protein [Opitutales bacterium]